MGSVDQLAGAPRQTATNGAELGLDLDTVVADWCRLSRDVDGSFDTLICPLRKAHPLDLLKASGFDGVTTYGDFQAVETDDAGFFIHVAKLAPR